MAGNTSRDSASNGDSRSPDHGGIWASPPAGARAPARRVPAAAPEGAEIWLTAPVIDRTVGADGVEVPDSVEWIEIVEDLRRDVVETEVVGPATEPAPPQRDDAPEPPPEEICTVVELAPAVPSEVNETDRLVAVLAISLEPEWPGNVHVYEVTIDPRDGTFAGAAAPSSNVPGETIGGVFGSGFTDIDFTAVYPGPARHYAWFGSGPLRRFTGADSRGNVFQTARAIVTDLAYVIDDVATDGPAAPLPAARAVEPQPDEPPVADEVAEPWFDDTDLVADAEYEAAPEPAVVEIAVESPADRARDHPATCRCVACRSTAFEPVPVSDGPLAGKAFYFRATELTVDDDPPGDGRSSQN